MSVVSPDDQRVTFVELFFDLVFVFSVTQVVGLLHEGMTPGRVAEATLVFWLVWWAWTQFTWALNALAVGLFLFLGSSAVSAWRATGTVLVARVAVAVVVAGGVLALGGGIGLAGDRNRPRGPGGGGGRRRRWGARAGGLTRLGPPGPRGCGGRPLVRGRETVATVFRRLLQRRRRSAARRPRRARST